MFEFLGKADNIDGIKRAFLDADAAADTELFGYDSLAILADDYGLVTGPYPGAVNDALGPALLRVAAILVDDGDSHGDQDEPGSGLGSRKDGDIIDLRYRIGSVGICGGEVHREVSRRCVCLFRVLYQ